jgi:hypothetical protein
MARGLHLETSPSTEEIMSNAPANIPTVDALIERIRTVHESDPIALEHEIIDRLIGLGFTDPRTLHLVLIDVLKGRSGRSRMNEEEAFRYWTDEVYDETTAPRHVIYTAAFAGIVAWRCRCKGWSKETP